MILKMFSLLISLYRSKVLLVNFAIYKHEWLHSFYSN